MADGSSGLPSSNRGVSRSGSSDARREALARGRNLRGSVEAELQASRDAVSRTWAGIDWLAGSVDLWDLLGEAGWRSEFADREGLAVHLRAFGPKPKPKGDVQADENGEVVTGKRTPFVAPDAVVVSIAQAAFRYLFEGTGLVLGAEAGPGTFYAYKFVLTNVFGDFAGSIEVGGELTERKGRRSSLRFELTGLGCGLYEHRGDVSADHAQRWCALRAKLEHVGTMLTRVDTAFDDFDGKRSLALAKCMWEVGEFDYSFAGERKRPQAKGFEDYGSGKGSTFYVGNSSSEKQLRVYEKGKQLGDVDSPWVRWELQMRSSTRKRITLDVLSDPLAYMRGAFECLDFVASCMQRLEVANEVSKATAKSVMRHAKRMYGSTLWMLVKLAPRAEDLAQVITALSVEKVPKWAKTGRLNWSDVPGLVNRPDDEEESSNEQ